MRPAGALHGIDRNHHHGRAAHAHDVAAGVTDAAGARDAEAGASFQDEGLLQQSSRLHRGFNNTSKPPPQAAWHWEQHTDDALPAVYSSRSHAPKQQHHQRQQSAAAGALLSSRGGRTPSPPHSTRKLTTTSSSVVIAALRATSSTVRSSSVTPRARLLSTAPLNSCRSSSCEPRLPGGGRGSGQWQTLPSLTKGSRCVRVVSPGPSADGGYSPGCAEGAAEDGGNPLGVGRGGGGAEGGSSGSYSTGTSRSGALVSSSEGALFATGTTSRGSAAAATDAGLDFWPQGSQAAAAVDAEMGQRILALGRVMCRAANGELFMMEVSHLQRMLLYKSLTSSGVDPDHPSYRAMERALAQNGRRSEGGVIRSRLVTRVTQKHTGYSCPGVGSPSRPGSPDHPGVASHPAKPGAQPGLVLPKPLKRSAVAAVLKAHAEQGGDHNDSEEVLDADLASRVAAVDANVAALRESLQQQAAAAKAAKAAAAAAELLPEGSSSQSVGHGGRQQHLRRKQDPVYTPSAGQGTGATAWCSGAAAGGGSGVHLPSPVNPWHSVKQVVDLNVAGWQRQRRVSQLSMLPAAAGAEERSGWDDIICMGDLYVKKGTGQGSSAYEAKCRTLGIPPCSQVLQALGSPVANMAHCKLGRDGAEALGVALAANTLIASLDLRDNGLDAEGLQAILRGIATATGAHLNAARRQQLVASTLEQLTARSKAKAATPTPDALGAWGALKQHLPGRQQQQQQQQQQGVGAGLPAPADAAGADMAAGQSPRDTVAEASPRDIWAAAMGRTKGGPDSSQDPPAAAAAAAAAEGMAGYSQRSSMPGVRSSMPGARGSMPGGGGRRTSQVNMRSSTAGLAAQGGGSTGFDVVTGQDRISQLGWGQPSGGTSARSSQPGYLGAPPAPDGIGSAGAQEDGQSQPTSGANTQRRVSQVYVHQGTTRQEAAEVYEAMSKAQHAQHGQAPQRSAFDLGKTMYSQLYELDLSGNSLGHRGAKLVAELIDPVATPGQFLEHLRLNKCAIPESGGLLLVAALLNANKKLTVLSLSNNFLGNKSACLFGDLLEANHTLLELDLSWNQVKGEGAKGLARGLTANATLHTLNLAWNGLENQGGGALGEMLSANMGLRKLDLSHARLGSEACLLLAEGLKANSVLEVLLLNGNNIGEDGARHLVVALHVNKSLHYLGLQGSNLSAHAKEFSHSPADFNPASPDGHYSLTLGAAAERAVAVQLAELDQASPADLMKNITLDGRPIASVKRANWPAALPVRGLLECNFASTKMRRSMVVMEPRQLTSLVRQLAARTMNDKERLGLVSMWAPFVYLSCSQIAELLATFSLGQERVQASVLLFMRCSDPRSGLDQVLGVLGSRDAEEWRRNLLWFGSYCFSFPQGHYVLNLSSPVHQALANRLKDASSAAPEGPTWINILYDAYTSNLKVPSSRGPPEEWHHVLPSSGVLMFDFLDTSAPGDDQHPLGDREFLAVLERKVGVQFETVGDSRVPAPSSDPEVADGQILALRHQAPDLCVTSAQVCKAVECFKFSAHRVEAAVLLYPRTQDRADNFWTVVYCLSPLEQTCLLQRLGPAALYDPKHCSHHWLLDCSNPAHEEVAKKLVAAAVGGGDLSNFWNLRLKGAKRSVQENSNMWGMLTADTFTPLLEFDFMGPDAWEALGKSPSDVASLGTGDKLDLRTKQAARLELARATALHPYTRGSSSSGTTPRPPRASYAAVMSSQADKPPWQAAWDRQMRVVLRLQAAADELASGSVLQDMFDAAVGSGEDLSVAALETALKGWGCSKAECGHFVRTAKALLTEAGAVPEPPSATSSSSTGAEEAGADGTGQLKSNKQRATDSSTSSSSAKPRAQGSALRSSTGGAIPLRASTGGGLPASNSAAAVGGRAGSSAVPRNGRLASATGASGALTSGPSEAAFTRGLTFEEFVAVITSSPTKGPGTAQAAAAGTASLLGEPSSSSVPGQQPGGRSSAAGSSNSNGSTGGGSLQAAPRKSAGRVGRGSAAGASGAVA